MTDSEILARWQGKELQPKFGCHCEIEVGGIEPDGCVIDDGEPWNCVYAKRIKFKESCQYWKPIAGTGIAPDYPNDAAACDSLLDTLVENGFDVRLQSFLDDPASDRWQCTVWQVPNEQTLADGSCVADAFESTRREAIVTACLEVARKELEG